MVNSKNYKHTLHNSIYFLFLIVCAINFVFFSEVLYAANSPEDYSRKLLQEEKELLKDKTFTVAYNKDHKPFEYTDENGNPNGTIIEMMNELASEYEFRINYKEYDYRDAIHSNYDIIIASVLGLGELKSNYQSSIAYHKERLMIIIDKSLDLQDLRTNRHVVGILEYPIDFQEIKSEFPKADFQLFKTSSELINAFDSGMLHASFFSRTLLDASMQGKLSYVRDYYNKENFIIDSNIEVEHKIYISNKLAKQYLPIFNIILSNTDYTTTLLYDAAPHLNLLEFDTPSILRMDIIIPTFLILVLLFLVALFIKAVIRRKKEASNKVINPNFLLEFSDFINAVEAKLKQIEANEYQLIGIDIDLFKLIVAYYGKETSEKLISNMTEILLNFFKNKDALITRIGKDHFLIFIKNTENEEKIRELVEDILTPNFKKITGQHYEVSFSVGTYIVNDTTINVNDMVNFSNLARWQGKNIHTNTFYTFDEVMNKQYHDKLNITYRMNSALENKEFILEYQPKIDLKKLKLCGAEALVRWQPSSGEKSYPADFIPVFEKNGFIAKLDTYVFEEVCKFIADNRRLCSHIKIACNLSPVTLNRKNIVHELHEISRDYTINPERIELEIVETVIDNIPLEELVKKINAFKEYGYSVALDDFGEGASSLSRFGLLPIDVIKFDKKFIDNIENEKLAVTVKNFISNSKELNLLTVAEGIETKSQLKWIKDSGCDIAQGYLFAKPQSQNDFIETLKADFIYLQ